MKKEKNPAAVAMGQIKSAKKAKAARINGRKGGASKHRSRSQRALAIGLIEETK